jgi:hypothetical protein
LQSAGNELGRGADEAVRIVIELGRARDRLRALQGQSCLSYELGGEKSLSPAS